jgi:hypothetical protein
MGTRLSERAAQPDLATLLQVGAAAPRPCLSRCGNSPGRPFRLATASAGKEVFRAGRAGRELQPAASGDSSCDLVLGQVAFEARPRSFFRLDAVSLRWGLRGHAKHWQRPRGSNRQRRLDGPVACAQHLRRDPQTSKLARHEKGQADIGAWPRGRPGVDSLVNKAQRESAAPPGRRHHGGPVQQPGLCIFGAESGHEGAFSALRCQTPQAFRPALRIGAATRENSVAPQLLSATTPWRCRMIRS